MHCGSQLGIGSVFFGSFGFYKALDRWFSGYRIGIRNWIG